jgi:hypothetical protein
MALAWFYRRVVVTRSFFFLQINTRNFSSSATPFGSETLFFIVVLEYHSIIDVIADFWSIKPQPQTPF